MIKYEEYHPFGSTAWWAGESSTVSQKRYRYTGMEKDEETGLSYHHHRYYATWLGRWTSSDAIGLGGGINRYVYCGNNPAAGADSSGNSIEGSAVDAEHHGPVDPGRWAGGIAHDANAPSQTFAPPQDERQFRRLMRGRLSEADAPSRVDLPSQWVEGMEQAWANSYNPDRVLAEDDANKGLKLKHHEEGGRMSHGLGGYRWTPSPPGSHSDFSPVRAAIASFLRFWELSVLGHTHPYDVGDGPQTTKETALGNSPGDIAGMAAAPAFLGGSSHITRSGSGYYFLLAETKETRAAVRQTRSEIRAEIRANPENFSAEERLFPMLVLYNRTLEKYHSSSVAQPDQAAFVVGLIERFHLVPYVGRAGHLRRVTPAEFDQDWGRK